MPANQEGTSLSPDTQVNEVVESEEVRHAIENKFKFTDNKEDLDISENESKVIDIKENVNNPIGSELTLYTGNEADVLEGVNIESTIDDMSHSIKSLANEQARISADTLHESVETIKKICEAGLKDDEESLFYKSSLNVKKWVQDIREMLSSYVDQMLFQETVNQLYQITDISEFFDHNGFQHSKLNIVTNHGQVTDTETIKLLFSDTISIMSFTFGICNFGRVVKDDINYSSGHATTMSSALNVPISNLKFHCGFIENFILLNAQMAGFRHISTLNATEYYFSGEFLDRRFKKSHTTTFKDALDSFYYYSQNMRSYLKEYAAHYLFVEWITKKLDRNSAKKLRDALNIGIDKCITDRKDFDVKYLYDALEALNAEGIKRPAKGEKKRKTQVVVEGAEKEVEVPPAVLVPEFPTSKRSKRPTAKQVATEMAINKARQPQAQLQAQHTIQPQAQRMPPPQVQRMPPPQTQLAVNQTVPQFYETDQYSNYAVGSSSSEQYMPQEEIHSRKRERLPSTQREGRPFKIVKASYNPSKWDRRGKEFTRQIPKGYICKKGCIWCMKCGASHAPRHHVFDLNGNINWDAADIYGPDLDITEKLHKKQQSRRPPVTFESYPHSPATSVNQQPLPPPRGPPPPTAP